MAFKPRLFWEIRAKSEILSNMRILLRACFILGLLASAVSAQAPKEVTKEMGGWRLMILGDAMFTRASEVVSWIPEEDKTKEISALLGSIREGYEDAGKILVIGGAAKEVSVIFLRDPDRKFGKIELASLAVAQRTRYVQIVSQLLGIHAHLRELKMESAWIALLLDSLCINKEARESYLSSLPNQNGENTSVYAEKLADSGLFASFMQSGGTNPFLVTLMRIFEGQRIYAVGLSMQARVNIPLASMVSKMFLKRDITTGKLDGTGVQISKGAVFVVKGPEGELDPSKNMFVARGYSSKGARGFAPTLKMSGFKAAKGQVSGWISLDLFTSSAKIEGFDLANLDGATGYKGTLNSNIVSWLDGAGERLAVRMVDEFAKLGGNYAAVSFFNKNVHWGYGTVEPAQQVAKVPDRILSFSVGQHAIYLKGGTAEQLSGEVVKFRIAR